VPALLSQEIALKLGAQAGESRAKRRRAQSWPSGRDGDSFTAFKEFNSFREVVDHAKLAPAHPRNA
jgi:hypothetical protein